jgi:hypothetical protein
VVSYLPGLANTLRIGRALVAFILILAVVPFTQTVDGQNQTTLTVLGIVTTESTVTFESLVRTGSTEVTLTDRTLRVDLEVTPHSDASCAYAMYAFHAEADTNYFITTESEQVLEVYFVTQGQTDKWLETKPVSCSITGALFHQRTSSPSLPTIGLFQFPASGQYVVIYLNKQKPTSAAHGRLVIESKGTTWSFTVTSPAYRTSTWSTVFLLTATTTITQIFEVPATSSASAPNLATMQYEAIPLLVGIAILVALLLRRKRKQ